jgi:hypothetical protein
MLVAFSIKAENTIVYEKTLAHTIDTGLIRTDPNLIYTSKEFYFDMQPYSYGNTSIKDFIFILTFHVGVNLKEEIKQIAFKNANMHFALKVGTSAFVTQTFTQYTQTFTDVDRKITITFIPDKPKAATTAKTPTAKTSAITKCVFSGTIKNKGADGVFTFYFSNGDQLPVTFSAMTF